jgi:hypothetical protein
MDAGAPPTLCVKIFEIDCESLYLKNIIEIDHEFYYVKLPGAPPPLFPQTLDLLPGSVE